ncbi:MAG: UvrD-helicase domain-containing protein [Bacteroidetes bacterium]|nr:UvrD-helicase domain-containing protein [Bacteroidota bacterium]MBT6688075.1 UvrD-helicase domain-containing protein [Bacteroidota bacterium]MBT7142328.1 UvrD-helicase domain-containing protein [Bacteroidota bacterium]MBT7491142.1 UvrD-helicase domain-containing protein [Bacteroidota bacterium]
MNYLEKLNTNQREAVVNYEGASLIIAGAGSGKTRVLTYRIVHLLNKGVPPSAILALTFTNKAAKEMKERIASVVGNDVARYLWMGTFHSKFASILRQEAEKLNYPTNFSIYDTLDSKNLLKTIIEDLSLDNQLYKPAEILGRISKAKNNMLSPHEYEQNEQIISYDKMRRQNENYRIYHVYTDRCKKAGAMDFDDLLMNTIFLFRDFPETLKKYQNLFKYILVDEYQDTNFTQYLIVKKLAELHNNICVVGDDAQSIYSFRGAKIENILNFKKNYPEHQVFKLEQNYRSTQTIVNAANSLIKRNRRQIPKSVFSKNQIGGKIKIYNSLTDKDEGRFVSNSIADTKLSTYFDYRDYAILYRTNAQSRIFEEALRRLNIPYKIYGGLSFYQRKEIKDMISYFRFVINPLDVEAFKRIINYPSRKIGKTTVDKIEKYSINHNISIWALLQKIDEHDLKINKNTQNKILLFVELIKDFVEFSKENDAYITAEYIMKKSNIIGEVKGDNTLIESMGRLQNIEELVNSIQDFVANNQDENQVIKLEDYIQNVSLLTNTDKEKEEDFDKVSLMTIHSAKGLEFKNVYVVGLEENLFPSSMMIESEKDIEEERRLFYVAITRAEQNLTISYAKSRYKWGKVVDSNKSRFIDEIDSQFVESNKQHSAKSNAGNWENKFNSFASSSKTNFRERTSEKPTYTKSTPSFGSNKNYTKIDSSPNISQASANNDNKFQIGMTVEHDRFGKGKVINIEGNPPNTKVIVYFPSEGNKTLLLKFAKLKVVG